MSGITVYKLQLSFVIQDSSFIPIDCNGFKIYFIVLVWVFWSRILPDIYIYMLRAMTKPALMTFSNIKPALMTFSNIKAINFYFNAKLTDFAMFSYRFNIWLTYCPM